MRYESWEHVRKKDSNGRNIIYLRIRRARGVRSYEHLVAYNLDEERAATCDMQCKKAEHYFINKTMPNKCPIDTECEGRDSNGTINQGR